MYLAYYEEKDYHTEIFGFILEFCLKFNHKIDYYNDKDQSYFIDHYEKLFGTTLNRFKNLDLLIDDRLKRYDYVIIGTMGGNPLIDDLLIKYPKKFIQIFHNADDLKKTEPRLANPFVEFSKLIVLTPLNREFGKYILPIFDYKSYKKSISSNLDISQNDISPPNRQKIITIVGRFTQHRTYEALLPLRQVGYTIWIIARRMKFVPMALVNLAKTDSNIKISYKLNAERMSEILRISKYIMCICEEDSWYYKDRLTGTIPLSFNYDLPIIIPQKLNSIYKVRGCIEYDLSTDIPLMIEKIDAEFGRYEDIVQDLTQQKLEIVQENHRILHNLLN